MATAIDPLRNGAVWLVILPLLAGCGSERAPSAAADEEASDAAGGPWFVDRARESGLDFVHVNGASGRLYIPEILAPGAALLDVDGDGDLDVFLPQGRTLGPERSPAPTPASRSRLYRNDLQVSADGTRTLTFTDVTDASGIVVPGYPMGAAAADVDNDGCPDLLVTGFGRTHLFHNDCGGRFTDVTRRAGLESAEWSVSASFFDYDRDGWLDLYVGHYVHYALDQPAQCHAPSGQPDYCTPQAFRAQPDRLYRNRGDGTFLDVSGKALAGGRFGPALGVAAADFDGDGWIDVYVANDGAANLLWRNQRDGTFRDVALLGGAALSAEGRPEGSMGVDAGDFDGDGDEDLFMTHLPHEGNNLYVNDGTGMFDDRSAASGLGPGSLGYTGFGAAWLDYDNDGWLDLLAVNGAVSLKPARPPGPFPYDERNLLFRNLGGGRFEDVTARAGGVFDLSEVSRGAAFGDLDNDGDTDVLVTNNNGPARLLLNAVGNRRHWLGLRLVAAARRDPIGARVLVTRSDGRKLWRRARTDGSYASANDPRVLVGLGDSEGPVSVRVAWPDGSDEEWTGVQTDQWMTLQQGRSR